MKNKNIVVSRPFLPPFYKYLYEIKDIWKSGWLTNNGPKHDEFENKLLNFLNVKYLELFTNGHQALEIIIEGLNLKGEVITTPFTFISTTNAILRNNIKPIFCDINYEDFTIDTNQIENLISKKTSGILPVHVYGNVVNIEDIEKIAKENNLKVIYDAAHSFGIKYKSKGIGNFGDASMFSLHATKVFNSIEGGIVSINSEELKEKLHRMKNFGISQNGFFEEIGTNAKMSEFQAAMGICNLQYYSKNVEQRKKLFIRYSNNLNNIAGITIPKINKFVESNYSYFPILITNFKYSRDYIYEYLKKFNIQSRKYFYPLTSTILSNNYVKFTPVADYISRKILVLPLHTYLNYKDIDYICEKILE